MRSVIYGALGMAGTLIALITAPAAQLPVEGSYVLGGQRIPLPQGAWQVLSRRDEDLALRGPVRSAPVGSVLAVKLRGDTVIAMVAARANLKPAPSGFGITDDCRRTDTYIAHLDTPRGSVIASCFFVGHAIQDLGPGSSTVWAESVTAIRERSWALPTTWLVAGYRVVDNQDFLDIRYYFNPEVFGLGDEGAAQVGRGMAPPKPHWTAETWSAVRNMAGFPPPLHDPRWLASSWAPRTLAEDHQRELLVRHLVHWAEASRPQIQAGFKNRDEIALAMPRAWTEKRSPAEGDSANGTPDLDRMTDEERALFKTLSWRAVGSTLDVVIAYLLTGSAGVAGAITVVGGAANATGYFLHELVWDAFGVEGGPGERTTELPPVAVAR